GAGWPRSPCGCRGPGFRGIAATKSRDSASPGDRRNRLLPRDRTRGPGPRVPGRSRAEADAGVGSGSWLSFFSETRSTFYRFPATDMENAYSHGIMKVERSGAEVRM